MLRLRLLPFALFGLAPACSDDDPPAGEDESSGAGSTVTAPETGADTVVDTGVDETVGGSSESGATGTTGDPDMDAAAHALFERWPGLWVGPVDSMTSVGDFPTMSMDARPADGARGGTPAVIGVAGTGTPRNRQSGSQPCVTS